MIRNESGFEMVMEMYTLDAGQTLVGVDMTASMSIDTTESGEELKTSMQMTADYDRLTDENGVSHQANAAMNVDSNKTEVRFDLYSANSGKSNGMLSTLVNGKEVIVKYEAEQKDDVTRNRAFDVYVRNNASAILEPSASDRPIIGFEVVTEPAAEETLAALEKANAENSVNVFTLPEAEMKALVELVTDNVTQMRYTVLSQLPTSILNLLPSGMTK